jgi:hypothetical protein
MTAEDDSLVDAAAGKAAGDGGTGSEACAKRAGRARQDEGGAAGGDRRRVFP